MKLGWIVQSKSPFKVVHRYPENSESGVVEALLAILRY